MHADCIQNLSRHDLFTGQQTTNKDKWIIRIERYRCCCERWGPSYHDELTKLENWNAKKCDVTVLCLVEACRSSLVPTGKVDIGTSRSSSIGNFWVFLLVIGCNRYRWKRSNPNVVQWTSSHCIDLSSSIAIMYKHPGYFTHYFAVMMMRRCPSIQLLPGYLDSVIYTVQFVQIYSLQHVGGEEYKYI